MALRWTMLSVLLFGLLRGLPAQSPENLPAAANEFVHQVVANEIKAEADDHSHWAFQLQTAKSGRKELDQVVETNDGNLELPVTVNGKPLTAKQKELHLQRLVHDSAALRKSLEEQNEDATRTQRLLKLLPDAFNFSYAGSSGDQVKLKFSPNPHFRPPTREAHVFHAMEGEMIVDRKQRRLAEISGRLIHEVKFGGGLLGHLDQGGQFYVRQEQVAPGYWELTVLNVRMQGKALFFRTISVQEETHRTNFRRVSDNITLAQAADLLRNSPPNPDADRAAVRNP
jgi:hypothetical protein